MAIWWTRVKKGKKIIYNKNKRREKISNNGPILAGGFIPVPFKMGTPSIEPHLYYGKELSDLLGRYDVSSKS